MYDVIKWKVDIQTKLNFHNVRIKYPNGLQEMISMFRMCATARLFIDYILPDIDSGIFLDTDILLFDDIRGLWSHFANFSPSQVMGLAPVENIYSTEENLPYFGPPGVGLNAGVMMLNLTRMRHMAGGGFTGAIRSNNILLNLSSLTLNFSDGCIRDTRIS